MPAYSKFVLIPCRIFRWQETDYRDFRINFIQFMRTPPVDVVEDGPEMVPVEIVAESKSAPEKEQETPDDVQQPVVLDAVVYEDAARAMDKLRAWPVQEEAGEELVSANSGSEQALSAAAAAAGAATAAVVVSVSSANAKHSGSSSLSDVDTSPPTPPTEQATPTGSDGDESDESVETAVVGTACSASPQPSPLPPPMLSSSTMLPSSPCGDSGDEESEDGATSALEARVNGGSCWNDQAAHQRRSMGAISEKDGGACSLGWSPIDEGNDADEELDDGGGAIRSRRSFSNLETARRGGAGLTAIMADSMSDGDQYGDGAESGSSSGSDTEERRPRALSLDGWFTCGLENGLATKSYETHDHAGRLRDLVKLVGTS